MQSISVFLDIAKLADFWSSKGQEVLGITLSNFIIVGYV